MGDEEQEYFATVGPTSDVGRHAEYTGELPSDPEALGEVVRGLMIHNWTAEVNGIESSPDRDGMRTFGAGPTVDRILRLDRAPFDQPRRPEERLIGYCYHFALVHCALLRTKGWPARTRCGFASYLADGKWTDHWVVEHWDGDDWRLNDPQIGLDQLAHDDFRSGVQAWQLCSSGEADPADHGIGDLDDRLDRVAGLATPGGSLTELRVAFDNDGTIRPPDDVVLSAS